MSGNWKTQFREVFDAGVQRRKEGCNEPVAMFESAELAFMDSIGCTAQAVRYEHFVEELDSQPACHRMEMDEFPPKDAEVEGIAWLPRLIVKTRAKLAGQLPADLMYG